VLGLHERRGDEGTDQPDRGHQLPMPQRDRQADERGRRQQHETGRGRHQFEQHAGSIGGAEQHGDPTRRQAGGRLVGDAGPQDLTPSQPFGRGDQGAAEQRGQYAARCGAEQALVNRVTDQEDTREHQGAGAQPDAPARREQRLDVGALRR
jgi:hypothetical protein